MFKKYLIVIFLISLFLIGCTKEELKPPLVISNLDCVNGFTDNEADFGLIDGKITIPPKTFCPEDYQCVSGMSSIRVDKGIDSRILTFPMTCDAEYLLGWSFLENLVQQGYEYDETYFSVDCCRVVSEAQLVK